MIHMKDFLVPLGAIEVASDYPNSQNLYSSNRPNKRDGVGVRISVIILALDMD